MTPPAADELAALQVFRGLPRPELEEIAALFDVRTFDKDAIIATEGDPQEYFYFILSGNVQAFWTDAQGHRLKLGIDEPGMHFPDQAITGEPTLVSHVAVAPLRVAAIRQANLMQLLQRHPEIAVGMLMNVAARLRRALARTRILIMETVYGRVAKLLLATVGEGGTLPERLTHAEIGHRVGATREMVGRVLRDLERGGYIQNDDGRITILKKLPKDW